MPDRETGRGPCIGEARALRESPRGRRRRRENLDGRNGSVLYSFHLFPPLFSGSSNFSVERNARPARSLSLNRANRREIDETADIPRQKERERNKNSPKKRILEGTSRRSYERCVVLILLMRDRRKMRHVTLSSSLRYLASLLGSPFNLEFSIRLRTSCYRIYALLLFPLSPLLDSCNAIHNSRRLSVNTRFDRSIILFVLFALVTNFNVYVRS